MKHYLRPANCLFFVIDTWCVFCDVGTSWTKNVVWTRLGVKIVTAACTCVLTPGFKYHVVCYYAMANQSK